MRCCRHPANKFCVALKDLFEKSDIGSAVNSLKDMRFEVPLLKVGMKLNSTAGGIDVDEVVPGTLESKLCKHLLCRGSPRCHGKRAGIIGLGLGFRICRGTNPLKTSQLIDA